MASSNGRVCLYVVRHAQPERWDDIPYAIPPGPRLSVDGRKQAEALAAHIAKRNDQEQDVGLVVSSPFARAHETATAIAGRCGVPIEVADALAEIGPHESWPSVEARVAAWWHAAASRAHRMVVVGHGASTNALLFLLGGRLDLKTMDQYENRTPQAGAWRVSIDGSGCSGALAWVPNDGTADVFRRKT